jgi:hypothetical protein
MAATVSKPYTDGVCRPSSHVSCFSTRSFICRESGRVASGPSGSAGSWIGTDLVEIAVRRKMRLSAYPGEHALAEPGPTVRLDAEYLGTWLAERLAGC